MDGTTTGPAPSPRLQVAGLWRYPVKSLQGEPLQDAELTAGGVLGDRTVHVRDQRGPLTGRTHHGLMTVPVRTIDGTPQVDGNRWDSPEAAAVIRQTAGPDAELVAYDGADRFDVLNLLVATDGAVERFGHDVRRLRPNLLISGVAAAEEATWPGQALVIGDAVIGIHSLRQRCIATTIDPDTGEQDLEVFRRIRKEFANQLALNSWVIKPGRIHLGDEVRVVATDQQPEHLGGWLLGAPYVV
jgi:uncharacterized protein YcbX